MGGTKRVWEEAQHANDGAHPRKSAQQHIDHDEENTTEMQWSDLCISILDTRLHQLDLTEPSQLDAIGLDSNLINIHSIDELRLGEKYDIETLPIQQSVVNVGAIIDQWAEATLPSINNPLSESQKSNEAVTGTQGSSIQTNLMCFGMIYGIPTRLIGGMKDLQTKLQSKQAIQETLCTTVAISGNGAFLMDTDGTYFGLLNEKISETLIRVVPIVSVEIEAVASITAMLRCINRAKRLQDSEIKVDINIYGNVEARDQIGSLLSASGIYLQHPLHRKHDFMYDNPHMIDFNEVNLTLASEPNTDPAEPVQLTKIQEVISEISHSETADRGFTGWTWVAKVKTPLLTHQGQALEFMIQRETGPIPDTFKLWKSSHEDDKIGFRHKITNCWAGVPHAEIGGGMLADDMGMGKTLSALSLVVERQIEARKWAHSTPSDEDRGESRKVRSSATLIVVPSMLIFNGWLEEIKKHLDESITVIRYHGKSRQKHLSSLTDCDIVLTTYHTLAAEHKRRASPVKTIEWFRIILDEAHTIRRRATTLYAAISDLDTCYRWCLSGTPIQNTLADLGSLLAFLQLSPFDKPSMFRKYIVVPFSEDLELASDALRTLLDSVCLRRSIHRLHLPPTSELTRYVDLTPEERQHYEETLESMVYAASYGVRQRYCDTPFGKFQIQLQLRLVCNHGTFQKPFKYSLNNTQTQREDVVSFLGLNGETKCSCCGQKISTLKTNCAASRTQSSQFNVMCEECLLEIPPDLSQPTQNSDSHPSNLHREQSSYVDDRYPAHGSSGLTDHFDPSGKSTKMVALAKDIMHDLPSTKSIVFSCWTRSLDLVELHLRRCNVIFDRIDGDTEVRHRQSILDNFAIDENIRVLLMTTGTGAYGLNLASANRVFILEPQWNPSIESQAVARAQRYLQTQSVKVIRYVVRGTVEEVRTLNPEDDYIDVEKDIRRQQGLKMMLAEKGFQADQS